jgi:cbb3-type cytochrome oxidase subunit 3
MELFRENVYLTEFYIYSCEDDYEVDDYIRKFPNLYFELPNNLEFVFTYKDLFREYNDRLYFMIIFKNEAILSFSPKWVMGEIFLRKYTTLFNYETREISFYRKQVEQTNINSKKSCAFDFSTLKIIKIGCGIIFLLLLIFVIFLLYRRYLKSKKINADELEEKDYIDDKKENKDDLL